MKVKNRYMIDNANRLIIKRNSKSLLVDGRFSINKDNQLIYWLNEPSPWRRQYSLPNKIIFKGNWQLDSNYDLELKLEETTEQYKDECLVIKGEIISTDSDALAFEIKSYDKQGLMHIQLLKLIGSWQSDEFNRISFIIERKTAKPDILTLKGIWQINQNQQIIYNYEKTNLKTRTKTFHSLAFEGFWQINRANRLTYAIERSSKSRFDFHVQIETPNLYPQEGVIKYRLGIGLKQERVSKNKIVSLYGAWKFTRKVGLIFQMNYGKGKVRNIEFDSEFSLSQKNKVTFTLKNHLGEPLGLNITFMHKFLKQKDAEAFLRLKQSIKKELGIEGGLRIPF